LQQKKKYWLIDIEADRAAEQAARLAYDGFAQKNIDCTLAIAAFDNYTRIASDKITEQMQYLYGTLLLDCDKTQKAFETFTKLVDVSKSIWRDKAALELLKTKINTDPEKILPQMRNFILNCKSQDEQKRLLRLEAMDIYCRAILGSDINDSATQVLNLLDTAEQTAGLRYDLFKAQALYQLGRLEESAQYMSKAIIEDSNSSAALAAQIASEIIDKIELWQKDANDSNELLRNCATLAEFAHKSANSRQTALLLAEVSTLQGKRFLTPFSPDENDTTWLRVQARLLMAQEKFEQSAKLWVKIAELRRNDTAGQTQKNWHWWQAKFYELDCLAKSPQADKQNIAHIIDVLCGSNPQIPAPWAEKLDILKRHCAAN
jgi:tetratricopeptide (TPR) repeat protein